jgi:hypothetical protein
VRDTVQLYADVGADEVIFRLCGPDLEQVERLAQVVG